MIDKKELEQMQAKKKAEKMFKKMMVKMLLEGDAPENVKQAIRVIDKVGDIDNSLDDLIVLKYTTPGSEANTETLTKVLEYLELVEVGIKQFVESTPYVAHTEEEEKCQSKL